MLVTIIISVGLTITILEIKSVFTKDTKNIEEGLELLDLENRIESLESGVKAHIENIRILSGNITKLQVETINLKADISKLTKEQTNAASSINNLTPFVDKTRGMAEDNTRRLDDIQKDE